MNSCVCKSLPYVLKSEDSKDLLPSLEKVKSKDGGWKELYICNKCGQYWNVDVIDKLQVCLCYRVDNYLNWSDQDDTAMRMGYLIKSRGGDGDGKCKWQGCQATTLKSLEFCAYHAYHEMGLRE